MSGMKPPEMSQFYRLLHERGLTTDALAEQVNVGRPTLCRVLNGARRRGPVWRRVVKLLTEEEITLLNVAQCSPWNKSRVAKRPKWTGLAERKSAA